MNRIGATATLEDFDEPYALLARLREREPVSWVAVLDGWLVTRRDLAMEVMNAPETFTVDDPRFSTGRVVGPSMLTLDGAEHRRHRAPFAPPFRLEAVRERFTAAVAEETERLIDAFAPAGQAELRRSFAGPLAAAVVMHALGLRGTPPDVVLGWYDGIVEAVDELTKGGPLSERGQTSFAALRDALGPALDRDAADSLVAAVARTPPGSSARRSSRTPRC